MRKALLGVLVLLAAIAAWQAWDFVREVRAVAELKGFDCWVVDPVYLRRFAPNCEGRHRSVDGTELAFRTNRFGLFERDALPVKDPRRLRVLLLGDSTFVTFHPGASLTDQLRERFRRDGVEIVNAAVPGFTLPQVRLQLRELLPAYQPDIVVLGYGFLSMGLNSAYFHLIGEREDAQGLIDRMGYFNFLWPVPDWLAARGWGVPELRQVATKLRSWQESMLLRFDTRHATRFMPARRNAAGIVDINRRYVQAIEAETALGGADFFLLRGNPSCDILRSSGPTYKSEFDVLRSRSAKDAYLRHCLAALDEVRTLDPFRTVPMGTIGRLARYAMLKGDVHHNPLGTLLQTDLLEKAIRHALRRYDRFHPGVRRRLLGRQSGVDLRS